MSSTPLALFVGLPNPTLSDNEFALFRETNPLGLFVGRRNLREPGQVKVLIELFREAVGREDAPVFTDQEGGRVQHLDAGPWPLFRSFGEFAELACRDFALGKKALRLSSQAMGTMMSELGLTSGCSPVLDLVFSTTSSVIGARAFGADPDFIAALGREVVDGLLETGNMPVMKHIPGHGRATLDSHKRAPGRRRLARIADVHRLQAVRCSARHALGHGRARRLLGLRQGTAGVDLAGHARCHPQQHGL